MLDLSSDLNQVKILTKKMMNMHTKIEKYIKIEIPKNTFEKKYKK